ncbi:hypothetical protein HID58_068933 [Brassica napus]|uniref:Uncharacterized protein n=1 Tax=Brassica napus TaxID=3708 RepID=A0ABQ7ZMT4_BRANA|nr:hypothetical protein HID58_068933 [Brassica napus]
MRVLGEITESKRSEEELGEAKKSLAKLSNRRSLLNLAWCCLQASECTPGRKVVLVAFLFHGNYANAREALTRTFLISGLVIGLHLLLKVTIMFISAIYLFGFGVELFIDDNEHIQKFKWGLWVIHKLLLAAIYGMILQLLIVITARPAFYKYITCMLALNGLSLFACALAANGAHFGLWLYGITSVCYHSFYLPLLYVTFLADFFQEEDLNLENVYYSEMKDAGFFDADWE